MMTKTILITGASFRVLVQGMAREFAQTQNGYNLAICIIFGTSRSFKARTSKANTALK